MFRPIALAAAAALALAPLAAGAAGETGHVEDIDFSFEGMFGTYDKAQLQRGTQVYVEVCASCHGMKFVPFRSLTEPGGPNSPRNRSRSWRAPSRSGIRRCSMARAIFARPVSTTISPRTTWPSRRPPICR
jgi:ubiquinol-cytochrome c reductase cytochrome c1 subunit